LSKRRPSTLPEACARTCALSPRSTAARLRLRSEESLRHRRARPTGQGPGLPATALYAPAVGIAAGAAAQTRLRCWTAGDLARPGRECATWRDLIRNSRQRGNKGEINDACSSPAISGRGGRTCQRVAESVRSGRIAYQGSLRPISAPRRRELPAAHADEERPAPRRGAAGDRGVTASADGTRFGARDEARSGRSLALPMRAAPILELQPPPRHPRGPLFMSSPRATRRHPPPAPRRNGGDPARAPGRRHEHQTGVLTVYRWELPSCAQKRHLPRPRRGRPIVPIIFRHRPRHPERPAQRRRFGRLSPRHRLASAGALLLRRGPGCSRGSPSLVAGDIVAAEDRNDPTLKTILTRSFERQQIFGADPRHLHLRVLADAITGPVALGGRPPRLRFNSIVSLSGTRVSAGEGLGLVGLSLAFYLVPILGDRLDRLTASDRLPQQRRAIVAP